MNDEKIYKIALITTVIGLLGIILLSGYVNPEHLTINRIDKSKIDNQVEVEAGIVSVTKTKSGTQIIKLNDNTASINLVIFPTSNFNTKLYKNQKITAIGRITQYNGELELILEEPKNLKVLR